MCRRQARAAVTATTVVARRREEEDHHRSRQCGLFSRGIHGGPEGRAENGLFETLGGGKNSRLFRRLVYEMQIAQDVRASAVTGTRQAIHDVATARPGQTSHKSGGDDEEIDQAARRAAGPREIQRPSTRRGDFSRGLERVRRFGGKANQLNSYYKSAGTPDYFQKDLDRYRVLTPADIKAAIEKYLPKDRRVELSVVPGDKK